MSPEAVEAYVDLCGGRGNLARIIRQGIDNTVLRKALRDENGRSPRTDIMPYSTQSKVFEKSTQTTLEYH